MSEKLVFHSVAEIFPLMTDTEFANLCADILQNGLREEIWTHDDQIIDGRNRYNACLQTGVEPRFRAWHGTGSLVAFVVSLNLHRRHLSESQRAMVGARIATMRQGERSDLLPDGGRLSQTDAAHLLNVSVRSVSRAAKVLDEGVQGLTDMVEAGELSVATASAIAAQPKGKQIRLIKKEKNKIVSYASNLKVERTLKKARTTHDICLICNPIPKDEIPQARFVAFLQVLARRVPGNFSRYIYSVVEEIEELEVADIVRDDFEKILSAIDAGYQHEADIARYTGLDRKLLKEHLKSLEDYEKIETVPQGGKTIMARGASKQLWQRKPIKNQVGKNNDGEDEDEFSPSTKFTGNPMPQSFQPRERLGRRP